MYKLDNVLSVLSRYPPDNSVDNNNGVYHKRFSKPRRIPGRLLSRFPSVFPPPLRELDVEGGVEMFVKSLCSLNTTWCKKAFFYSRFLLRVNRITTLRPYSEAAKSTCNIGRSDESRVTLVAVAHATLKHHF